MAAAAGEPNLTVRQRIAAKTPGGLRKSVRVALNYLYRLRMWLDLLRELEPADGRSRRVLWISALAAPFTALHALDSYRKPRLFRDIAVRVRGIGRFTVRAATDDLLHVMTSREPRVRQLLEAELPQGGTFVDGGANIGFYTLLAARRVGAAGKVVAFEMMPDTAAILRRHVADNGPVPVEVIERALSERSGERVTASVEPGQHGQASIIDSGAGQRHKVSVETVTLDEALAHLGRIDLIKLDLEGAEFMALSGARAVLARTGCLVFESNDQDPRIFALLEAAGFAVERLDSFDFVARPLARAGLKVAA
jgi:FkbM family methyltransferase